MSRPCHLVVFALWGSGLNQTPVELSVYRGWCTEIWDQLKLNRTWDGAECGSCCHIQWGHSHDGRRGRKVYCKGVHTGEGSGFHTQCPSLPPDLLELCIHSLSTRTPDSSSGNNRKLHHAVQVRWGSTSSAPAGGASGPEPLSASGLVWTPGWGGPQKGRSPSGLTSGQRDRHEYMTTMIMMMMMMTMMMIEITKWHTVIFKVSSSSSSLLVSSATCCKTNQPLPRMHLHAHLPHASL